MRFGLRSAPHDYRSETRASVCINRFAAVLERVLLKENSSKAVRANARVFFTFLAISDSTLQR